MTVSIPLLWLVFAAIALGVGAWFAALFWSGRITRGKHAFHCDELSVAAVDRDYRNAGHDEPNGRHARSAP